MWKYNYTDELYHYGVIGMRWNHRKAKEYNILKAKTKAKLSVSTAKYNGNKRKAANVNTVKNVASTAIKASVLTSIGANFVATAIKNKKLIKISGGDPITNRKIRIGTAAVVGLIGAASIHKGIKTVKQGVKRQKIINNYSKNKGR